MQHTPRLRQPRHNSFHHSEEVVRDAGAYVMAVARSSRVMKSAKFTRLAAQTVMEYYQATGHRPKDRKSLLETVREVDPELHRAVAKRVYSREVVLRAANRRLRRCESPIWNRRPVHRAPARSIGTRTKSTRKRSSSKPTKNIDPDPSHATRSGVAS